MCAEGCPDVKGITDDISDWNCGMSVFKYHQFFCRIKRRANHCRGFTSNRDSPFPYKTVAKSSHHEDRHNILLRKFDPSERVHAVTMQTRVAYRAWY
jgi:hypothetical protein